MSFHQVLAQSTVSDLPAAERWYSALFGRGPDQRPMDGLLEWHLASGSGLQVWSEPERAGRSTVVLRSDDLDDDAARASDAGLQHEGPQPASAFRVVQLTDPDGNRVVLVGE